MHPEPPFRLGLNPYGLTCALGLQGTHPQPLGLTGFVGIARELGARSIELDWRWLTPMAGAELDRLGAELADLTVTYSHWLAQQPEESLDDAVRRAAAVKARVLRLHLTPVLEGARAAWGVRWDEMLAHARRVLRRDSPRAADAGLILAIENHQDLGSEELLEIAIELGEHAGIVLDTGNPFSVGEDPVAFTQRAAGRIRHVHLKDYVAQFTAEGFRLVRCAVGEGAVPFAEMLEILAVRQPLPTVSLELAALEARHIRLFTPEWWTGYPPRAASELGIMLGRLRRRALPEDADYRTPWERQAPAADVAVYELEQVRRSFENMRWVDQINLQLPTPNLQRTSNGQSPR